MSTPLQRGQALVESMVVLLVLAVLWVAIHWLAHYQDMALSATHASRLAAFQAAREVNPVSAGAQNTYQPTHAAAAIGWYFSGVAHRWTDRRGIRQLDAEKDINVTLSRAQRLSPHGQPGAESNHASRLRREWSVEDAGILQARVQLSGAGRSTGDRPLTEGPIGLRFFDSGYPPLMRSTSILTHSGHVSTDQAVQRQVAASRLAWASPYAASRAATQEIMARADGVDGGWDRSAPSLDWLVPWAGRVPGHLIQDYPGG